MLYTAVIAVYEASTWLGTVPACRGHSKKSGERSHKVPRVGLIGPHYTWPPIGWPILTGLLQE